MAHRHAPLRHALWLSTVALVACTGLIEEPSTESGPGGKGPGSKSGSQALCTDVRAQSSGPAPLRRLTRAELTYTIADLLGADAMPDQDLIADEKIGGFSSNSIAPLTLSGLEEYESLTAAIADRSVTGGLATRLGCDPTTLECVQSSTASLGRSLFRRPLSSDEVERYVGLFEATQAEEDGVQAAKLWLQAMLLSPHFLYHVERSTPSDEPGVERLDGPSIAARLSYFFWHSAPDAALMEDAESGALDAAEGRKAAAERLMSDARFERGISVFVREWLAIDGLAGDAKDAELFPEWTPELGALAVREAEELASYVMREGDGSLQSWLTASYGFPRGELAALYGVAPSDGEPVPLGAGRSGLLTQVAFLASHAHSAEVSWVHRGKLVRERLLCQTVPAPPPVDQKQPNDPNRLEDPVCRSCHIAMDPIGMGFDAFDAIGRYHADVQAEGEVIGSDDPNVDGKFSQPSELASRLADSDEVERCIARQWYRYAVRRIEDDSEACAVSELGDRFVESQGDLRSLMLEIATHEAFVTRRIATTE